MKIKPQKVTPIPCGCFLEYLHGEVGVPWRVWPDEFASLLSKGWITVVVLKTETVLFRPKRKP